MKKLFLSVLAMFAMVTSALAAPEFVTNATGNVVYGAHALVSVKKDITNTATNRVYATAFNGNYQYVNDDAAWSKYAKLVAGMGTRAIAVDNDPSGLVISVADSNGVYCQNGQSLVAFPSIPAPIVIADSCAFWTKVKALSN